MPAASKKTASKNKAAGGAAKAPSKKAPAAKRTAKTTKRRPDKRALAKKKQFFSAEIKVIVTALCGLFLFLSNFGVLGTVGNFFSGIERGLFGTFGYAFPVLLLLAVIFYVKNQGTFLAEAKLFCLLLMVFVLSALSQLLFGTADALTPAQYYAAGAAGELGGGAVGGILAGFLRGFTGTIGAYLILIALLIICMVFVTERSFVNAARTGAEKTARAASEGRERAKEAAQVYRERRAERREEERLRREDRIARGVDFDAIRLHDGIEKDAKAVSEEAQMYAGYGRELIGGQPGIEDVDDGTGHGVIRQRKPAADAALCGADDDSRFDTQILPGPDSFRGRIEGVPDYDDDSVPFDETEESPYRSYRFEAEEAEENGTPMRLSDAAERGYAAGDGESGLGAAPHETAKPREMKAFEAAGAQTEKAPELKTETPQEAFSAGSSFGERWAGEDAAEERARAASEWTKNGREAADAVHEGDAAETYDTEASGAASYGAAAGYGASAEEYGTAAETDGVAAASYAAGTSTIARTVTASGKELAAPSPDAQALLQKKLAGEIDRIDTGDEQHTAEPMESGAPRSKVSDRTSVGKPVAGSDGRSSAQSGAGNAPTAAENQAVAAEIKKKTAVQRPYVFPPLSLLKRGPKAALASQRELKETAVKLQQVLHTFGVGVTVTNVSMGPSVTRYELQPDAGVKVSRITSLSDDIKLALAAADIRIEAPIPGKAAVGIEVPNKQKATVYFRDIVDTEEFRSHPSKLAFAIGRDIAGKTVVGDIAKMPHLLIAGATGSGKSVGINTLIMSLIYKSSPEDVRMIMVDPKVVELSVYNGIPHLLIPVVTDPKKAASALNWAVAEMTDRYKKFAETGVRDLKGYNKKAEEVRRQLSGTEDEDRLPKKLPQIVIIIDELADLMMVAPGEVEDAIIRLTQLARAAGLHLVIATQRPSVNVITGLIKANVPSRIAFQTASGTDSRTILDMNGAEKLMGSGDMLYYPAGAAKPARVQGSFISDGEVQAVVDFLTRHGAAEYSEEIGSAITQQTLELSGQQPGQDSGRDEYFEQAGRLIIDKDKASIGMLQRMFKIGFNRAARVMDQLSEAGVVGPEEGTKPRKILMTEAEFEAFLSGK